MTTTFTAFKKKALKKVSVRAEYAALGSEYELVRTIIRHRIQKGWSQAELAEAVGSRQPVISRLEQGEGNPSLRTLQRIADALDLSLCVSMK